MGENKLPLAAVILAAGKGTRMKSSKPKVLHPVGGVPMLVRVIRVARQAGAKRIIVVAGYGLDEVEAAVQGEGVEVVLQEPQLGTAHALLQAAPFLEDWPGHILVLCGDTPLLTSTTLEKLYAKHCSRKARLTVLTAVLSDPGSYGRILRDADGYIRGVKEAKDCNAEEKQIKEINSGTYCLYAPGIFTWLREIRPNNAAGEYYLTDLVALCVERGEVVAGLVVEDVEEIIGVNDRLQLAVAEGIIRRRVLEQLMRAGVTVMDPATTFVEEDVIVGQDTVIYPFCIIKGKTVIGANCCIGPNAYLRDAVIGENCTIRLSVVEESHLSANCTVGPFAYLRPGCWLEEGVKVGDFVELKKATIGSGSKVPHLSYIGDAFIGAGVNIGAGTITCNYDGERKWETIIADGAFIGSNSNLVAPVKIGERAYIAAGSTITADVPPGALGVARGKQKNIEGWVGRKRKKESTEK